MKKTKLSAHQEAILREMIALKGEVYMPRPKQSAAIFKALIYAGLVQGLRETGYKATSKGVSTIRSIDNPPQKQVPVHRECCFCFKTNVLNGLCPDCGRSQNKKTYGGAGFGTLGDDLDIVEKRDLGWNYG